MRRFVSWVVCVGVMWVAGALACTKQEARDATDAALSVAQIVCIETSDLIDESALSAACKIADTPLLRSVLRGLIGQRAAAKRAGFLWPQVADASTDATASKVSPGADAGADAK